MDLQHPKCAGLDVHQHTVACARAVAGSIVRHERRTFGATTADLLALSDWLTADDCTHVALESTGVYWNPIWQVLEGQFTLVLANAMHIRNIPGRKSDVNDATWIADLLAHGLIRGSFVPPGPRPSAARSHLHPQTARAGDHPAYAPDSEDARDRQSETHRAPQQHPGRERPRDPPRPRGGRDRSRALGRPGPWPPPGVARRPRRRPARPPYRSPPLPAPAPSHPGGRPGAGRARRGGAARPHPRPVSRRPRPTDHDAGRE